MELHGKHTLLAPPEMVWAALHDTDLLAHCVPGCQGIRWISENTLEAEIELRAGGAYRTYRGEVRITDQRPPDHYRLLFGKSDSPGSVVADIGLAPKEQGTHLSYHVNAGLDGYLARLGTPIVNMIARRIANRFFKRLNDKLTEAGTT